MSTDTDRWRLKAACRGMGTDEFFRENTRFIPPICDTCPVRTDCLNYSIENDIRVGVYGGISTRQRIAMIQSRNKTRPHVRV